MEGLGHGAIAAGVSSVVVTSWARKESVDRFDPTVDPPSVSERLSNRAPLLLAGLGFTGLSTAVAMGFDKVEMMLLQDYESSLHYQKQAGNHHKLHSLPYLGAGIGTAHLIKHTSTKFGSWVAEKMQSSELASDVITQLENLADWVIDSAGAGVAEHLVGDIPTSGRGGTALRLLAPITDRNFCLNWVKATSNAVNQYLVLAGGILSAAAWTITGAYVASWKPPERRIGQYVETLRDCDGFTGALRQVHKDLTEALANALSVPRYLVWDLPIFSAAGDSGAEGFIRDLFTLDINPGFFGVDAFEIDALSKQGVIPSDIKDNLASSPLYSQPIDWPTVGEIPLVISDNQVESEETLYTPNPESEGLNLSTTSLFSDTEDDTTDMYQN